MARIEEENAEKAAVTVLIEDKPGHTKDIKKKLTRFFKAHVTVSILLFLLSIAVVVIIILAVKLSLVRNTDDEQKATINEAINQVRAACEDDWIWYQGKCHYFSEERDTWENSQKFCVSHNASLALIDNQKELTFLNRVKGLDHHWIGLRRTDDNKAWIWTNGTLYNESLFKIERPSLQGNVERVFLNDGHVKSKAGHEDYKWICNKT